MPQPCEKGSALTYDRGRNTSYNHVRKDLHLNMTMAGTRPATMSENLMDTSVPLGGNLDLENIKLLPEVLQLHPSQ